MDDIIEDKIIELVTAACQDDVETDIMVNISKQLEPEWKIPTNFPSVVVSAYGWVPIGYQVGALQKEYTIFIAALVLKDTVAAAKTQRAVLVKRIDSIVRQNQQLTGLVDTTGKERAFHMEVVDVRYAHAGFSKMVQAVAHFRIVVDTNLIGPF